MPLFTHLSIVSKLEYFHMFLCLFSCQVWQLTASPLIKNNEQPSKVHQPLKGLARKACVALHIKYTVYEFSSPLHYLTCLGRSRRRLQRHSFVSAWKMKQSHPPKETEKPRVKPRKYNSREQRQAHLNGTSRSYFRQFYCSYWKHGTARDGERGVTRLRRSCNCARFNPEDIFLFALLKLLC